MLFFKSNKYKIITNEKMKNFEKEFQILHQPICDIENEMKLHKTLEQVVNEFCNISFAFCNITFLFKILLISSSVRFLFPTIF